VIRSGRERDGSGEDRWKVGEGHFDINSFIPLRLQAIDAKTYRKETSSLKRGKIEAADRGKARMRPASERRSRGKRDISGTSSTPVRDIPGDGY